MAGFALGEDRNAPPLQQSAGHLIFYPCSITDISALMVQAAAPQGRESAYIAITVTIATLIDCSIPASATYSRRLGHQLRREHLDTDLSGVERCRSAGERMAQPRASATTLLDRRESPRPHPLQYVKEDEHTEVQRQAAEE